MFTTDCSFIKELLPCEIGAKIWTISDWKSIYDKDKKYKIESDTCMGFVIDKNPITKETKIRPAYDTWDGWCPICDDGFGYYTSKEEAEAKVKELKEMDEFMEQNKWLEEL